MPLTKKHKKLLDRACQRSSPQKVKNQILSAFGVPWKSLAAAAGLIAAPGSQQACTELRTACRAKTPMGQGFYVDPKNSLLFSNKNVATRAQECLDYVDEGCHLFQWQKDFKAWQKDFQAKFDKAKKDFLKDYEELVYQARKKKMKEDGNWTLYDAVTDRDLWRGARDFALLYIILMVLVGIPTIGAVEVWRRAKIWKLQRIIEAEKKKLVHHWPFDKPPYEAPIPVGPMMLEVQQIESDYPILERLGAAGGGSPTGVEATQFVLKEEMPWLLGLADEPPRRGSPVVADPGSNFKVVIPPKKGKFPSRVPSS